MKTDADNYLRTACEFHVFITILVAFAMKSDLSHETVSREFYDYFLWITMAVFVLGGTVITILLKWGTTSELNQKDEKIVRLSSMVQKDPENAPVGRSFLRYCAAVATTNDYKILQQYFERLAAELGNSNELNVIGGLE